MFNLLKGELPAFLGGKSGRITNTAKKQKNIFCTCCDIRVTNAAHALSPSCVLMYKHQDTNAHEYNDLACIWCVNTNCTCKCDIHITFTFGVTSFLRLDMTPRYSTYKLSKNWNSARFRPSDGFNQNLYFGNCCYFQITYHMITNPKLLVIECTWCNHSFNKNPIASPFFFSFCLRSHAAPHWQWHMWSSLRVLAMNGFISFSTVEWEIYTPWN